MQRLRLHLLGGFHVTLDGQSINSFRTQKTRALLAYLVVEARPHQRDHLAGLFWPEWPDVVARTYLRQALTNLRRLLDGDSSFLLADNHAIQIDPAARAGKLWLDTAALAEALSVVAACKTDDDQPDAIARLEEAATLYHGDFLQGFCLDGCEAYQEWQSQTARHIQREMLDALGRLGDWHERQGNIARALQYVRQQVELEPWIEVSHRKLMQLLMLSGEPAAALAHYEQYRRRLATELNAEPEAETQALYEGIRLRQIHPYPFRTREPAPSPQREEERREGGAATANEGGHVPGTLQVPGTSEAIISPPNNLPAPLNPLIGRDYELMTVRAVLRRPEVRLVTLAGPGGVGKTRLSQQIAADLLGDFPDGVFFVSLASTREPELVPSAIAQALDVRDAPHQPLVQTLMRALRAKSLLLVLDNFEHVASVAPVVTELLHACPHLKVLVTSREVLHLNGEHEFIVPPLACPRSDDAIAPKALADFPAVELFRQRAVAARHDFVLDDATSPVVAEICMRLDGLPLAIELAAARVRHLSPQAMLQRLGGEPFAEDEPSPTLQLLQSRIRDIPPRHRSLRDAITWSYALLDAEEQALFRRLAIFVGGWTIEAAEAICGPDMPLNMLDGLMSLMDKHLVQLAEDDNAAQRFTMLETLREYGLERLRGAGEVLELQQRMAGYYVRLAETAGPRQHSPGFAEVHRTLRTEHANIRVAFQWALTQREADLCLRLCAALHTFWTSFPKEGEQSALATLDIAEGSPPSLSYARTLACAGYFSQALGNTEVAYQLMTRSLAMREAIGRVADPLYPSVAIGILAWIEFYRGNYDRAEAYHLEQLAHERQAGHDWALAMSLVNTGMMYMHFGDFDTAGRYIDEALALHRKAGQAWGIAKTLNDLGELSIRLGQFAKARSALTESLALCQGNQLTDILASVKYSLGLLAMHQADYRQAAAHLGDALLLQRELGGKRVILGTLEAVARLALRVDKPIETLRLAGATSALWLELGFVAPPLQKAAVDDAVAEARRMLTQEAAEAAWREGEAMSLNDAIAFGLKLTLAG